MYHDTVCPWCRIGHKGLMIALDRWDGPRVRVRHRPHLLDDSVPPDGVDFRAYIAERKGGEAELPSLFAGVERAGKEAGLRFRFDLVRYAPNTRLSHRLVALTPPERRDEVLAAVYGAYFEEGRNIGELDTLAQIASERGLERDAVAAGLRGGAHTAEVREEAEAARRMGVTSVPLFVVEGEQALAGAQPPEALLALLQAGSSGRTSRAAER
jgi:predicted DsbA family dithiol-disulfide isomerase